MAEKDTKMEIVEDDKLVAVEDDKLVAVDDDKLVAVDDKLVAVEDDNLVAVEEDKLVAVIIAAGTLGDTFYPATQNCPLALLPVVNNPLIFYSFEWLRRNKVDETIIYCNEKDAEDIMTSCTKWSAGNGNRMKLMVVSSNTYKSLGDAIRDLDGKSLLKKDFILLDGFVVGNTNLQKALRRHKESVNGNPNCIMTCLYQRRAPGPPGVKPRGLDNIRMAHLLVNSVTSRILNHYRPMKPSKSFIPSSMFCSSPRVRIWSVEDPYISICSEKVPMLCAARGYDTMDTIIQDVLHKEQLLKYNLRAYIPRKGFMMLVSSLRAFEELSLLLVKRWFSPILVPETSLSTRRMRYKYDDEHDIYFDEQTIFHKNSLGRGNVIGAKSEIDKECKMNNTVVGRRCIIRGNVTINNSFLMDRVTIGNGCVVTNCFLGRNVRLFPGVHLDPGVIIGPNTKLGPSVKIYKYKRVVSSPPEVPPDAEPVPVQLFPHDGIMSDLLYPFTCGKEGQAYEVKVNDGITRQEDLFGYGFQDLKWGEFPLVMKNLPRPLDSNSQKLEDMEPVLALDFSKYKNEENEFGEVVMDSLIIAYTEESKLRSIMQELNSSWDAYNISEENALRVIVKNVLHVVEKIDGESKLIGDKLWQRVSKGLMYFQDYIRRYVKDHLKNQLILLNLLEELVGEEERYITVMHNVVHQLNQELELIEDEVLLFWYKKGGHGTEQFPLIASKIKKFVELLDDASDEEDNVE